MMIPTAKLVFLDDQAGSVLAALVIVLVSTAPYVIRLAAIAALGVALAWPAPHPAARARTDAPIWLVVRAGDTSYVPLAPVTAEHARPSLVESTTAIAAVSPRDVPASTRAWLDREVIVDGNCRTRITGFAILARVAGAPEYAPGSPGAWTAHAVLAHGAPQLAARLAGCDGTVARDASAPPPVVATEVDDRALARKARAKLLASGAAHDAQYVWEQAGERGAWQRSDLAEIATRVVQHPLTGARWVSVHAKVDAGCGGADINLWALYRVRDNALEVVEQRELGDLWSIHQLVDIDRDGNLELVGSPWLGTDRVLVRTDGEELARVARPFYGCPC